MLFGSKLVKSPMRRNSAVSFNSDSSNSSDDERSLDSLSEKFDEFENVKELARESRLKSKKDIYTTESLKKDLKKFLFKQKPSGLSLTD
jgi:hypothetical protein